MTPGPLATETIRTPRGLVGRALTAVPGATAGAAALLVAHQLAQLTVPVLVGLAIDEGMATGDPLRLAQWLGLLVLDGIVLAIVAQAGARLGLRAFQLGQHRLRLAVVDRLLAPGGLRDARPSGELLSVAASDVSHVSRAALIAMHPVAELAALAYAGALLTAIAWPLGIAVLGGGLAIVLLLDLLGRTLRTRTEDAQDVAARATGIAADLVTGAPTLRALGATDEGIARHAFGNARAVRAAIAARRAEAGFTAFSRVLAGALLLGIALAAAGIAVEGGLAAGQFVIVLGLVQLVFGPLEALAVNLGAVWASASASARRVLALLRAPERRPDPVAVPAPADGSGLRLRGVAGIRLPALDLAVAPGEIVGFVAEGAVCAELVGLLASGEAPARGVVELGGSPLENLSADELARRMLVAPARLEEAALAPTSDAALRAARATGLGDPASPLSGGERQRLALAAALASAAAVLVLHEPTSAVDPETERRIADALPDAVAGRAVLLVTTAPALLARADRVVAVAEDCTRTGRHAELLGHDSYRDLVG